MGPLHFEDLEPRRFEDLSRELLYDFRNWQTIEATGRAGSDDGFDVRAWEKTQEITNQDENNDDEGIHPMEGNLWMIQCKREKELGPSRVSEIIQSNVDEKSPPYGYILIAPVNFSKKSYDTFRNDLREKGVTEFYLWGKAELEDMLLLPKHDHILFAFFGISLVSRRRSKTTEVRFSFNNKNKLLRVLSNGKQSQQLHETVLVRDINDENYPFEEEYPDFKDKPRWAELIAWGYHPLGLYVHVRKYFAYIDIEKKEYDFIDTADLLYRKSELSRHDEVKSKLENKARDYWEHLPRINQATFYISGIVFFKNILAIDDKGDIFYDCPQIYVDRSLSRHLLDRSWGELEIGNDKFQAEQNGYKRIKYFPKTLPNPKKGAVYKDRYVEWDNDTNRAFLKGADWVNTLYDVDGKHNFLKTRDIIALKVEVGDDRIGLERKYLEVTHKYEITVATYLQTHTTPGLKNNIEKQVGRTVNDDEKLTVFEIKSSYLWES